MKEPPHFIFSLPETPTLCKTVYANEGASPFDILSPSITV